MALPDKAREAVSLFCNELCGTYMKKLNINQLNLLEAIKEKDLATVKDIMQTGCDPNFSTDSAIWPTPVALAIMKRNLDIVKVLVEKGAHLKVEMMDFFSTHPDDLEIANYISSKMLFIKNKT